MSRYTPTNIFPAFLASSGDFLTVPGAKKAITANSTPVLGEHGQQTSIKKYYFIKVTKMLTELPKNSISGIFPVLMTGKKFS